MGAVYKHYHIGKHELLTQGLLAITFQAEYELYIDIQM